MDESRDKLGSFLHKSPIEVSSLLALARFLSLMADAKFCINDFESSDTFLRLLGNCSAKNRFEIELDIGSKLQFKVSFILLLTQEINFHSSRVGIESIRYAPFDLGHLLLCVTMHFLVMELKALFRCECRTATPFRASRIKFKIVVGNSTVP